MTRDNEQILKRFHQQPEFWSLKLYKEKAVKQ